MRREEMMSQIMISLEQLTAISDIVFNKIDKRINSLSEKLLDIDQRRTRCAQRIQQIKLVANKATKIYANYKYPKEELSSYSAHLEPINVFNSRIITESEDEQPLRITSKHIPFDDQLLKEKTQFYSIPKSGPKNHDYFDFYDVSSAKSSDPLGPTPWHRITSLSTLLVFNSADNAFMRRSQGLSAFDHFIAHQICPVICIFRFFDI